MKTIPFLAGLLTLGATGVLQAQSTILNDFDSNQNLEFSAQSDSTLSIENSFTADADSELKIVSGSNGTFGNYAQAFLSRESAALLGSSSATFSIDVGNLAGASAGAYNVQLAFFSDIDGAGYTQTTLISLSGTVDSSGTLSVVMSDYSSLASALASYGSGSGSYFGIALNNGGYNFGQVTFSIDNVRIEIASAIPEPSTYAALAGLAALALAARRRRRA